MSPFGIAVVGVGGVAANHLSAIRNLPAHLEHAGVDARLVGVVDVDAGRARAVAAGQGADVRAATSLTEALDWEGLEGVIVCTPNVTHAFLGLEAIAAGKHVLMEKPLAITLEDCDRMVEAARSAGVVLMPGQTQRYYGYGLAAAALPVGAVRYARFAAAAGWIWGDWRAWVLDPAVSGGHILHNGVHGLDLVDWLIADRPIEVVAAGVHATASALRIWDWFEVAVRYANGAVGSVEFNRAGRPKSNVDRELTVVGEHGIATLAGDDWGPRLVTEAGVSTLGGDWQGGFDREVAAWVLAATASEFADPVPAEAGRRAVALALAAERSIAEGRAVAIDA